MPERPRRGFGGSLQAAAGRATSPEEATGLRPINFHAELAGGDRGRQKSLTNLMRGRRAPGLGRVHREEPVAHHAPSHLAELVVEAELHAASELEVQVERLHGEPVGLPYRLQEPELERRTRWRTETASRRGRRETAPAAPLSGRRASQRRAAARPRDERRWGGTVVNERGVCAAQGGGGHRSFLSWVVGGATVTSPCWAWEPPGGRLFRGLRVACQSTRPGDSRRSTRNERRGRGGAPLRPVTFAMRHRLMSMGRRRANPAIPRDPRQGPATPDADPCGTSAWSPRPCASTPESRRGSLRPRVCPLGIRSECLPWQPPPPVAPRRSPHGPRFEPRRPEGGTAAPAHSPYRPRSGCRSGRTQG